MQSNKHADRARVKGQLYSLVGRLYAHGVTDVRLLYLALKGKRSKQRIRQVLADLGLKQPDHDLRDRLSGLPPEVRADLDAFVGAE